MGLQSQIPTAYLAFSQATRELEDVMARNKSGVFLSNVLPKSDLCVHLNIKKHPNELAVVNHNRASVFVEM